MVVEGGANAQRSGLGGVSPSPASGFHKVRHVLEGDRTAVPGRVPLATVAREWLRLGCIGFGGPPTHIALLRRMCVEQRHWLDAQEFEDGISATSLLPGPASTPMALLPPL